MKQKKGLSEKEVEENRKKYGENKIREYKKKSFLSNFAQNLSDPIIRVLMGAFFINIIFMFPNINWLESGGIALAVFVSTLVSTVSEYSSQNAFEKLKSQDKDAHTLCYRDGELVSLSEEEIVVSDTLVLEQGNRVLADCRVIDGSIKVDESSLTGESTEIEKNKNDLVLKGSLIVYGKCEAIVEAIGENTFYGQSAKEIGSSAPPQSPLKKRLFALAESITKMGYFASFCIAFSYLLYVFVFESNFDTTTILSKLKDVRFVLSELLSSLTLAVSILVVAVPEGLPMMITVVLSSNMKKMAKDSVLVRKLIGIETSGNINILFTDKTGTLTEGKLKVKEVLAPDETRFVRMESMQRHKSFYRYFSIGATYCNQSAFQDGKAIGSDATDRAVLDFVGQTPYPMNVLSVLPFDSQKKYSSCTVSDGKETVTFYKGAGEQIAERCSTMLAPDGTILPLSQTKIQQKIASLCKEAYRVVALAMQKDSDTVLIALICLKDKIRKEVPSAIQTAQRAGVRVVMITGDNPDTALAIAKECGIAKNRENVLTGKQMSHLTDDEISELLPRISVIARALPNDKSRLVKIAQSQNLVVGMTGDGINDAPSLKSADVGFAMGAGTDVAKEAGDIIIKDNNFLSIVKAISYGRTIFDSIRKFIVFQLTMNLGAVGICLIGPFIGVPNPVTVTQMLWVNMIMDTLGALAFSYEPTRKEAMQEPPKRNEEPLISRPMIHQILSTGAYLLVLFIWFLKSETLPMLFHCGEELYVLTGFFGLVIFTGIFVCFTSRTTRVNILSQITKNPSFIWIMMLISVMQLTFIYFGKEAFRTTPLSFEDLCTVIFISATVIPFDFLRKLLYKKERKRQKIKTFHFSKEEKTNG